MVKEFEFCPKCKGTNIQTDFGNAAALGIGTLTKMCANCGYSSRFFPVTNKKPKMVKNSKNNNKIDVGLGYGAEKMDISIFIYLLLFIAIACLFMRQWLVSAILFVLSGLGFWLIKLFSKKST